MEIGFIGAGKMGEAIIASLINSRVLAAHEICAYDVSRDRQNFLKRKYGINVYSKNKMVGAAQNIFFAVKPQDMDKALKEIAPVITKSHLIISIAAGKTISSIEALLPGAKIIRVMPNIAVLVSEGMSVFCSGATVIAADKKTVVKLLSSFGKVVELPENKFDTVTALSGSGPAFFTYFLEKMVAAAVHEGMDRNNALLLAKQTMLGTSKLLIEKNVDPESLINDVTSGKGTTAAGLEVLKNSPVSDIIQRTINAAARRSKELSA